MKTYQRWSYGGILFALVLAFLGIHGAQSQISPDPKAVLVKAIRALGAKAHRMKVFVVPLAGTGSSAGSAPTTTVEYIPPDRYHTTVLMQGRTLETIKIGARHFLKGEDGRWVSSQPIGNPASAAQMMEKMMRDLEEGKFETKLVGNETLNGVPTQVYQMNGVVKMNDVDIQGRNKLWIGPDGSVLKQESEAGAPGQAPQMKTIQTYEYPSDLKIEAPPS
jgi:hypothetical protein